MNEIRSKMYVGFYVKYPLLLADFNENWIFSTVSLNMFKY